MKKYNKYKIVVLRILFNLFLITFFYIFQYYKNYVLLNNNELYI